ncbi:hypothetical protein OTB20_12210 [Streptomyces sp. H27-H1]|uniref:hypothetical protein n=1 Tax=unclassified Streptomyces TaxID=2593676 RepID=UPI00226EE451|nr:MULTISPECIES: hypothetical protein [unclassified Streptomyces]MCY0926952.1 hypothetical protein [Streptomyces sp. H27-H1]MCY0933216.1 hypothetical protein [Streptomyces sp. H34-S4]
MADARESNMRRLRRLREMDRCGAVTAASAGLKFQHTMHHGPDSIALRTRPFVEGSVEGRSLLSRLVLPRGVALRFYLLAIFDAHCRLVPGSSWTNRRPLSGQRGCWSDFVAIDGAYDGQSRSYMPETKQIRDGSDLRLRQIKSALTTLEGLGPSEALVTVPRDRSGRRLFQEFALMKESGRGVHQTPDVYSVPTTGQPAEATFAVPSEFFLNGWIQVLNPSEIATWLILQYLSQWAANTHAYRGVYLYGRARVNKFGIKRDAWEDGCQRLHSFGLIHLPHAGFLVPNRRKRYEPNRWQVDNQALRHDAMEVCLRELTIRQRDLEKQAVHRRQLQMIEESP